MIFTGQTGQEVEYVNRTMVPISNMKIVRCWVTNIDKCETLFSTSRDLFAMEIQTKVNNEQQAFFGRLVNAHEEAYVTLVEISEPESVVFYKDISDYASEGYGKVSLFLCRNDKFNIKYQPLFLTTYTNWSFIVNHKLFSVCLKQSLCHKSFLIKRTKIKKKLLKCQIRLRNTFLKIGKVDMYITNQTDEIDFHVCRVSIIADSRHVMKTLSRKTWNLMRKENKMFKLV